MRPKTKNTKTAQRQARDRGGVQPYPGGWLNGQESIEAGERSEEVPGIGLSKAQAIDAGRWLVRCLGRGYRLRVWQNLGWHYAAISGGMNVHPFYRDGKKLDGFHTLFGFDGGGILAFSMHPPKTYKDPRRAVLAQLAKARKVVQDYQKLIDGVSTSL